jgi:hypothetical protein
MNARCKVGAITHHAIVIHGGRRIDDHMFANTGIGIYDSMGHDQSADTYSRSCGYGGRRVDHGGEPETVFAQPGRHRQPRLVATDGDDAAARSRATNSASRLPATT